MTGLMEGDVLKRSSKLRLRADDLVEVRGLAEIVATLDDAGTFEGLPFMPEMAGHCGRRYRVAKVGHKTCDTINNYKSRRMKDAVLLDDLRCDGAHHGGCQAGCRFFWKLAWLKPVAARQRDALPISDDASGAHLQQLIRTARREPFDDGAARYRCQATEHLQATSPLPWWEPTQYVRDLLSRNVTPRALVGAVLLALGGKLQNALHLGTPFYSIRGTAKGPIKSAPPQLAPGDLVMVRSRDEIMATLDAGGKERGLWFDVEMLRLCGTMQRVLRRVERIVDEKTGRLLTIKRDALILEGGACTGLLCRGRRFCPRGIYSFWRESWLLPVNAAAADLAEAPAEPAEADQIASNAPTKEPNVPMPALEITGSAASPE
jgi:hypothetical protein